LAEEHLTCFFLIEAFHLFENYDNSFSNTAMQIKKMSHFSNNVFAV